MLSDFWYIWSTVHFLRICVPQAFQQLLSPSGFHEESGFSFSASSEWQKPAFLSLPLVGLVLPVSMIRNAHIKISHPKPRSQGLQHRHDQALPLEPPARPPATPQVTEFHQFCPSSSCSFPSWIQSTAPGLSFWNLSCTLSCCGFIFLFSAITAAAILGYTASLQVLLLWARAGKRWDRWETC